MTVLMVMMIIRCYNKLLIILTMTASIVSTLFNLRQGVADFKFIQ